MSDKKQSKGIAEDDRMNPLKRRKVRIKKEKMPELMRAADRKIQDAIIELITRESFFGNTATMIKRKRDFSIPTAGVYYDNGFVLTYNPAFVLSLSKPYTIGLIKHEIFHLIFKHMSRRRGINELMLWNVAADLAINSILKDYVPKGGIFPDSDDLASLKLPFERTSEFYYAKLLENKDCKAVQNCMSQSNYSVKIKMPENQQDGGDDADDQNGTGAGGDDIQEVEIGGRSDVHDWERKDRDGNDVPEDLVEIDIQSLLKKAYDISKRTSKTKMWGNTPASVIKEIEDFIFKKSEIPWHVVFRRLVLFAKNIFNVFTRQKRNKKYGYAFPGHRVKEKLQAVVIFDTSGSVSEPEFLTCCNELQGMVRCLDSLHVIHADVTPYSMGKFTKNMKMPPSRKGYGGTAFEPSIRFAEEKYKPDVIIYMTDGYASWDFKPSRIPMVWVITNDEVKVPKEHGRFVKLEVDKQFLESDGD